MSVERKDNGALRVRCDVKDCEQKFVPLRPFTEPRPLRERAELYHWTFSFGRDFCPTHSKEPKLGGVT